MNSFLALRDQEVKNFIDQRQDRVRDRVEGRLRTLEFWGDVIELFVPVMADTVSSLVGGEPSHPDLSYRTIVEDDRPGGTDEEEPPPPTGPGGRNEIIR